MGRSRKRALFPVALTLDAACECTGIRRKVLADAVYVTCVLPAHVSGKTVLVLVVDLVEFIRSLPRANKRSPS